MRKVIIKPDKKIKAPKGVLDVIDNSKRTPTEEVIDLVRDGDFNRGFLLDDSGNLISAIPFTIGDRLFIGVTPNPVDIYFGIAYTFLNHSVQIFESIKQQKEEGNFSFALLSDNKFNSYLQYRISCIILLHSTLEAFINSIIPDENYTYPKVMKENRKRIVKHLTKEQIERLDFSEKFKDVVKDVTKLDFAMTNPKIYVSLINLNKLRCDLIHLKTIKDGRKESYIWVYIEIVKASLDKYFDDVREYINIIKPNTILFTVPQI